MKKGVLRLAAAGGIVGGALVFRSAQSSEPLPVAKPIVVSQAYDIVTDRVRRNETLEHVLRRHNVTGGPFLEVVRTASERGLNPRRILPGMVFSFRKPVRDHAPDLIQVRLNDAAFLRLVRDSTDRWTSRLLPIDWSISVARVTGSITGEVSSLNQAVHAAIPDSVLPYGERDRLIWNTAEAVYGWVVDFTRDPRPGDAFSIVYERLESATGDVRYGRVLAARYRMRDGDRDAYLLTDAAGRPAYFDQEGRSLHRAFLKYPVSFRRISSGFTRRRFHPILKRFRAHLGTDYAAYIGTPIRTTGDGVVRFAGRDGGYGNMVAIRHPKGFETRYAHMSRIENGIRAGVAVRQGQTIGRVGMTGLANGPHVHYEFIKNGQPINHRNVDLGDGEPIPDSRRAEFEAARAEYDRMLGRR